MFSCRLLFNIPLDAFSQQLVATDLKEVRLLVKPEYLQNGERNSCQTGLIFLVHLTNNENAIKTACNKKNCFTLKLQKAQTINRNNDSLCLLIYRMTQKRGLLKNPTKIEEIQEKKIIDRN